MPEQTLATEGSVAPDFRLKSDDGKTYSMSQFRGKKEVVLYFYPKDDTPGCTKEACSFRDTASNFANKDVRVLGVSLDYLDSHTKFRSKYSLNFPLLSDPDHKVADAYGVYNSKTCTEKNFGASRDTTFIIDKSGKIRKAYRRVQVDGHTDDILRNV